MQLLTNSLPYDNILQNHKVQVHNIILYNTIEITYKVGYLTI